MKKKAFLLMPSLNRYLPLQTKLTAALLITAIVPMMAVALFSYHKITTSYERNAIILDLEHLEKANTVIDNDLNQASHDLTFLSEFHDLKRYFLWHQIGEEQEAQKWLKSSTRAFFSFMNANALYMQLRVIDTDGWEVIRINRDNNDMVSISNQQDLQRKHQSDYFTQTMQMKADQYYVSRLNLNREHGKIQKPYTPVIRYALPIIDQNGIRHGIIVINLFARQFLDEVARLDKADSQEDDGFFIVNQDGFYLSHTDKSKVFGFDLGHSANLILEYPELWEELQNGHQKSLYTSEFVYTYKKIFPLKQDHSQFWHLIHIVPTEILMADLIHFKQIFFSMMIALIIFLIFFSGPLIQSLVRPIRQVTKNLQRMRGGETNLKVVNYKAHDEIRDMVEASNGMSMRISEAIKQANNIARGDFHTEITPVSDKDELGLALHHMTNTLRKTTDIVTMVAKGDLSRSITQRSDDDLLGISLNQMIASMQATVRQANLIAEGDFRSKIQPRSDQDMLGIALLSMTQKLRDISQVAVAVSQGDYNTKIIVKGEFDQLGTAMTCMTQALKSNAEHDIKQNWLKTSLSDTALLLQNQSDAMALANSIMQQIPDILQASHGAFYIADNSGPNVELHLSGSYAYQQRKSISNHFSLGEGLIGQCGLEKRTIILTQVPEDYIKIKSALGEASPTQIIVVPLLAEEQLMGVMELATTGEFSNIQQDYLEKINQSIGLSLFTLQSVQKTNQLLEDSQSMTEELQAQEEELREANATLLMRAEELTRSEEEMQAQQEELRLSNDELIQKNIMVEAQKQELTDSTESLALQATRLQQASQYKSDFLSNMSHELRTPLNSLLLLSDMLANNKDGNLTDKQVQFASTIHDSGIDLLTLINSILDLAKVEAGKMSLDPHRFPLKDISDAMRRDFAQSAEKKEINFQITQSDHVPDILFHDAMRIKQVLKNLLSNALKFTHKGEVQLHIELIDKDQISFSVSDSGVGIAADKMQDIFESFQQEDGSTTRKYGGTGLGLSICREFARLLGGHINVTSKQGSGSTFALIIPIQCSTDKPEEDREPCNTETIPTVIEASPEDSTIDYNIDIQSIPNPLNDDRDHIDNNDHTILIIEDDESFASIQQGLVQEHGFKAINALRGDHGLMLAHQYIPDAILLDLQLPVLNGMNLLDRIKQHPKLRHIPVHVISCMEQETEKQVLQAGAISFVHKPASKHELDHILDEISSFIHRDIKRLLIVENDEKQLQVISALLTANDVEVLTASRGIDALNMLKDDYVDCMILDLGLPDMSGEEVLARIDKAGHQINQGHLLPIIVHTGRDLSPQEVEKLQQVSKTIIVKGSYSSDRLLAETSLFLHQVESEMSEEKQQSIEHIREQEVDLNGKHILLVDDDIRNIYSLSSYLEAFGVSIYTARNGLESLDQLKSHADDIDLILMDIMMPEMNGFEAMQKIRQIEQHQNLPIIALTAKAMKGDREQCIAAGASDYITKPINTDKLISLIRVWLHD